MNVEPGTNVVSPAPTNPTPSQEPGPPPAEAKPTEAQIKEATDYVVSRGYNVAAATKIVSEYGALRILADKALDAPQAPGGAQMSAKEGFTGELVAGRTAVRVFDVDGNKPLKIEAMRDAGTEIDIYVRIR